jgi:hypothetical protein
LDWQNTVIVCAAQAALGLLSTGMRAIFVEAPRTEAVLHVVITADCGDGVADDLQDIAGHLEAALGHVEGFQGVSIETYVEDFPTDWAARGWRGLYWCKGWAPGSDQG